MKTSKLSKSLWSSCLAAGILLTALPASAQMIHRYSFNEPPGSTTVIDSVGGSNGVARALSTTGGSVPTFDGTKVTLDGAGGYIDLPNGLVSGLTNVTLEFWATWTSGGTWCRLLDFGTSSTGEDPDGTVPVGTGGNYMFLSPTAGSTPRFAITGAAPPGNGSENPILNSPTAMQFDVETYVVVTYGPAGARMFIDGNQVASGNYSTPLSAVVDVNDWLGRSNWPDPFFGGSFNEFRMHSSLLTQLQILASKAGGPNATDYTPESPTSITLMANSSMTTGTTQTPDVDATFPTYGSVVLGAQEVTLTSSQTSVVAVDAGNVLRAVAPGTATITASLSGQTNSASVTVTPPVVFTALKHRYSFNEANGSTTINDSVGGAAFAGTVNPPIDPAPPIVITNGAANFPAGGAAATAPYISLPPNMISTEFTNVTIEFWFTWNGPANGNTWARVFDFGSSSKGTDPHVNAGGLSYFMFTPRRGGGGARNEFRASADNAAGFVSTFNDAPASPGFPVGREVHVVSTFAPSIGYSALYVDGLLQNIGSTPLVGTPPTAFQLSQLVDPNIWLGVSQYNDPPLSGQLNEFRIYEGVLDELKMALDRKAGPNALPVSDPGTLQSVSLQVSPLYISNPATSQAILLGDFQNVTGVDITSFNGVQLQSSDTNVFTVTAVGGMTPVSLGTASLIASYKTFSKTSSVSVLAPSSLTVTNLPATVDAGRINLTVSLLANFAGGISNVDVSAFNGVTRSSSDTNVATITGAGVITVRNPGATTITSTYSGLTNTATLTVATPAGFVPGTLIHRYSFNEVADTTTVKDSVGTADGAVANVQFGSTNGNFTGTGQFMMGAGPFLDPPTTNAYINLPNGLISSLSSVTVEGWFTWFGGVDNQRVFDFGMSSATSDGVTYIEDVVLNPGRSYFFLSPQTGRPRFAMKQGTDAETPSLQSPTTITITASNSSHFAIVYDQPRGVVRLYVNGQRAGTAAATLPLSVVDDRNDWIGRSQWQDPYFNGSIDEFRIYNGPMLDSDIAAHFAAGPNALPAPRPTLSFTRTATELTLSWPTNAGAFTLKSSPVIGTGATWTPTGGQTVVGSNNQVTVPMTGNGAFYRLEQ